MLQFDKLIELTTGNEIRMYIKRSVETDLQMGISEEDAYRVVGTDYKNLYCLRYFSCNDADVRYLYFRDCNKDNLNCFVRYDRVLGKLERLTDYVYFGWVLTEDVVGAVIWRKGSKETSLSDIAIADVLIKDVYSCRVRNLAEAGYVFVAQAEDHSVQKVYGVNLAQRELGSYVVELPNLREYANWSCYATQEASIDAVIDRTEVELWLKNENILSGV